MKNVFKCLSFNKYIYPATSVVSASAFWFSTSLDYPPLLVFLGFVVVLLGRLRLLLQPLVAHDEAPEEAGHERYEHDVESLQLRRIEVQHRQQHAQRCEERVHTRDEVVIDAWRRCKDPQIGRAHV